MEKILREKIILNGHATWLDRSGYPAIWLYPTEQAKNGIPVDVLYDGKKIGSDDLNEIEKKELLAYLKNTMENEIINKMAQLPDRFLAVSFNILFGNEWKSHWDERSKAAEMISILKGNTQPCCPFVKWMQCIAYLMETIKAN